jgi:hypothetical protein
MTDYVWNSATSGDWFTATSWSPNGVPTLASDTATINAAGAYVVTIAAGETAVANRVAVTGSGATLDVNGMLDLGGGLLAITAGMALVGGNATVANGEIAGSNFSLANGAWLSSVTNDGVLDVTGTNRLNILGGITGGAPGAGILVNDGALLDFESIAVVHNEVITLGTGNGGAVLYHDLINNGGTLVLDSQTTIRAVGSLQTLIYDDSTTGTILNLGTIDATGANLFSSGIGNIVNANLIEAGAGGTFTQNAASFVNTGTLLADGGTIVLDGLVSLSQSGVISLANGGILGIGGTFDLGGSLFSLSGSGLTEILGGGTMANGTVDTALTPLSFANGAWLSNMENVGALSIAGGSRLNIENGLTGGTNATLNVGDSGVINAELNQTISHEVITLGSSNGGAVLYHDLINNGGTLVLDAQTTVRAVGSAQSLIYDDSTSGTILNLGTIDATGANLAASGIGNIVNANLIEAGLGGTFTQNAGSFINTGTLLADGGTIVLDGHVSLAQAGIISLANGGMLEIGGTLDLGGSLFTLTGSGLTEILGNGTMANGTVNTALTPLSFANGAWLSNMVNIGVLSLASSSRLNIENGLTGGSNATLAAGDASVIDAEQNQTISQEVITLGSSTGSAVLYHDLINNGGTLVLDAQTTVRAVGSVQSQIYEDSTTGTVLNQGIIDATGANLAASGVGVIINENLIEAGTGGTFTQNAASFINTGTLLANGGTIVLGGHVLFAQTGLISLSGGGVLGVGGTLDLGGSQLSYSGSGLTEVLSNATLANGTVNTALTPLSFASGAWLSGIVNDGALSVANGVRLNIENGLTGGTNATLATGDSGVIDGEGSLTFANEIISLGSSGGGGVLYHDLIGNGGTMVLDSQTTVRAVGSLQSLIYEDSGTGTILNQGTIDATGSNLFASGTGVIINENLIKAGAGGTFTENSSSFINTGTLLANGGTIVLAGHTSFGQTGVISLASGGVLGVSGLLDLGGSLFTISGSGLTEILSNGTMANGTISDALTPVSIASNGWLSGMVNTGTLSVANGSRLNIENGLTGAAGTIDAAGNAVVDGEGSQTIQSEVINLGSGTTGAILYHDLIGSGGTLVLGSLTTINAVGTTSQIYEDGGATIVNDGTISANNNASLQIGGGGSFINAGLITIGQTGTVTENITSFGNTGSIAVDGIFDLAGQNQQSVLAGVSLGATGLLEVGGRLDLSGGSLSVAGSGHVAVLGGGTLTDGTLDLGVQNVTFNNSATLQNIELGGSLGLTTASQRVILNGNISGAAGASIDVSGSGAILDGEGGTTIQGEQITLGGNAALYHDLIGSGGTLLLDSLTTLTATGSLANYLYEDGGGTIANAGTVEVTAGALALGGNGSIINTGLIEIGTGGTLLVQQSNFINSGSINLAGGTFGVFNLLSLAAPLSLGGNGVVEIGFGDTLTVATTGTALATTGTVDLQGFIGAGTGGTALALGVGANELIWHANSSIAGAITAAGSSNELLLASATAGSIDLGSSVAGFGTISFGAASDWTLAGGTTALAAGEHISGFNSSETIVLEGYIAEGEGFNYSNKMYLSDANGVFETIVLGGGYDFNNTTFSTGGGNTTITTTGPAPCFCAGTRIFTEDGPVAVENLRIGDLVKTAAHGLRAIKWIGTRFYDGRFIAGNHRALPVRIRRHALGFNVPSRDLFVSPDHAICEGGVLVHAWRLINGVSITQAQSVERVDYFHVELDSHDIIFAENTPTESFLDTNCRERYQNAAEFYTLYPDAPPLGEFCLPLVEYGFYLARIKDRIDRRAGIKPARELGQVTGSYELMGAHLTGWARNDAAPETPVELDIFCDGQMLTRIVANQYREELRGPHSGCHAFDVILPPVPGCISLRRAADGAVLPEDQGWMATRRAG